MLHSHAVLLLLFFCIFASKFNPAEFTYGALCQKERGRESFALNVLSSGKSHTHSVCRYVVVGTLKPKQQPFKKKKLAGWGEAERA